MSAADLPVLATIATLFLIREGGKLDVSSEEWQQAIDHESTIFLLKPDADGMVFMALLPKDTNRA